MKTILLIILPIVFFMSGIKAQRPGADSTLTIDTTAILQDLANFLDSADKPTSYGLISIGVGNRLFSVRNNQLNAKQSDSSKIVFNPAIGYFHKSGLSISAGANLLNDGKKFGVTQYSINPAFDLHENKNFAFGISYSHYFIKDKYSLYSSPVQNDFYTYLIYKKTWIEPGIAIGYATGNFTEIFKGKTPGGIQLRDTGTFSVKTFSMIASASHSFEWYNVFGKRDGLSFTPSLQLSFSSDSTENISHTISPVLVRFLKKIRRIPRLQGKNNFEMQSVGFNLEANYTTGNFSILPQLYFDYFLPETDEKRFTQVFALSLGYSF
jgi:hypothetical protein